eukprot:TRINITY_DN156_c0_g1_i8.p2 TRINITY_DN156_c0_g1~~TRINITY_DN156_c0_g1_i8.p2  ORF type:complete len:104 (-),score=0.36 TRINITY_DN156_c0_g1_i8:138-449(-)
MAVDLSTLHLTQAIKAQFICCVVAAKAANYCPIGARATPPFLRRSAVGEPRLRASPLLRLRLSCVGSVTLFLRRSALREPRLRLSPLPRLRLSCVSSVAESPL